jgi:hypothetical protein
MERISVCHACGRTVDSAFSYCPWCGAGASSGPATLPDLDTVFERVEEMQRSDAVSRISRMESELGDLERDLSLLLAEAHPS